VLQVPVVLRLGWDRRDRRHRGKATLRSLACVAEKR
jgi:hypothetical protein